MYEKNKIINNKKFFKIYLLIKYKKIHYFEKKQILFVQENSCKMQKKHFFYKK